MKADLPRSLKLLGLSEGGYSNHPRDPGGATMYGVTHSEYDAYRRHIGAGLRPVRQCTLEEAHEIFRLSYWVPVHGDELPAGLDYAVFDGAINSGPNQSVKWLQRALNASRGPGSWSQVGVTVLKVDGWVGIKTLDAASRADLPSVIPDMLARRLTFLKRLDTWDVFGVGWTDRLHKVQSDALGWHV